MELIGGRAPHGFLPVPEGGTSVLFPEMLTLRVQLRALLVPSASSPAIRELVVVGPAKTIVKCAERKVLTAHRTE